MSKKYYTVKEVANMLSLAEITIRKWMQDGKINYVKIGEASRIPIEEIKKIIKPAN